jgi:hypothetical protein
VKLLTSAKKSPHVNDIFRDIQISTTERLLLLLELFQEDREWNCLALQVCASRVVLLVIRGNVESLCLYQNEMDYGLFASLGMIFVTDPKHLTTLDLEAYFFAEGVEALAQGLSKSITLRHLDLCNCRFGVHAAYILARGLQGNRHLEYLQLGTFWNRFEFTHNWNSCTLERSVHVKLRSPTVLVPTKAEGEYFLKRSEVPLALWTLILDREPT